MKRKVLCLISFIALVFSIIISCNKDEIPDNKTIYFPVGRISVLNNNLLIGSNDVNFNYETIYDNCGGYWLRLNSGEFPESSKLIIDFQRTNQKTEDFVDDYQLNKWSLPSKFIDSDNKSIISKAAEITKDAGLNIEKAKLIHQYILNHINFTPDFKKSWKYKASETLEEKCGCCVNFSRLYVALCRAAGLPARTIWGIVYSFDNNGIYDYHHQWAEVSDEDGIWHVCDLNYTTVFFNNNIKYLDLIYAPEENSIIQENKEWAILLKDIMYLNDYPFTTSGRLGFELINDNRPDSMLVEYVYEF